MKLISSIRSYYKKKKSIRKSQKLNSTYAGLSNGEVFSKIYNEGTWGEDANSKYFSGTGSHDPSVVEPYIASVSKFLANFPQKPKVLDVGCGDFAVGSRLCNLADGYIAADVVKELIDYNKSKYIDKNVDFRVIDITKDELPKCDVIFIRQVLQHLSNKDISSFLSKVHASCGYLVVTEHIPLSDSFEHNPDKQTGSDVRVRYGGGVVVTSSPFNFSSKEETILCEVAEGKGRLRTTAYKLR